MIKLYLGSLVFIFLLLIQTPSLAQDQSKHEPFVQLVHLVDSHILSQSSVSFIEAHELLSSFRLTEDFSQINCADRGNFHYKKGISLFYLNQIDQAIHYLNDSSFITPTPCDSTLPDDRLKNHRILARLYRQKKEMPLWEMHLKEAVGLIPEVRDTSNIIIAGLYKELADLYKERNDFSKSIELLTQAVHLYAEIPKHYLRNKANAYTILGEVQTLKGLYAEASENLGIALNIYKSLDAQKHWQAIAVAYLMLVKNAKEQHKYTQAIKYADTMQTYLLDPKTAEYLNLRLKENRAHIYMRQKKYDQALSLRKWIYAQDSMTLVENQGRHILAVDLENIGDVYAAKSQESIAIGYYNRAIQHLVPAHSLTSFYAPPDIGNQAILHRTILLRILQLKARTLKKLYCRDTDNNTDILISTFDHYNSIDTLIYQIRKSFKSDGSKYHLSKQFRSVYSEAIDCSLELLDQTQDSSYFNSAYHFASTYKAAVFQEYMHNANMDYTNFLPDSLALVKRALEKTIQQYERHLYSSILRNGENQDSIQAQLFLLQNRHDDLMAQLELHYPVFHQDRYLEQNQAELKDIQMSIPDSSALIEYLVSQDKLYIFYITGRKLKHYEQVIDSSFQNTIDIFSKSLQDIHYISTQAAHAEADFLNTSHKLYELLLGPIQDHLLKDQINRLIIIPDGTLSQMPFEPLHRYRSDSWLDINATLLSQHSIRYLPTHHWLLPEENKLQSASKNFGGYGIEYDDQTIQDMRALSFDSEHNSESFMAFRNSITKLPYADEEIIQLQDILQGDIWLNEKATRAHFMEHAQEYKILHIAAHSFVNREHADLSSIVFSRSDTMEDNLLLISDIYTMPLKAELVTLSACNTGSGPLEYGEGVLSIGRAFKAAGARSIVASAWSVPDKTTVRLMTSFYEYIKAGHQKDIALQWAKLDYLSKASPAQRLPLYWAPFILSGDETAVKIRGSFNYAKWCLLLLIAALAAALLWRRNQAA